MSTPPPKHSLSSPTSANTPQPVLPTPSSSTTVSARQNNRTQQQQRKELEHQLAEKQRQLQESSSGIGKNVLARQVSQLQDKLRDMDTQSPDEFSQAHTGSAIDRLKSFERDLSAYRPRPLSPGISSIRSKEKLLNQRSPTHAGMDPLPSPSTSTLLPPAHGHDSASLLPLPPPPTGSTPTKRRSKIPNTDRRNTDIEFATEIGQGLLLEVRKMQALLQEKEEKLRTLENQKADLERAAEAMAKQMRQREENEEKLKEETWNLELAKQELVISVTDLQTNLSKANAEQNKLAKQVNDLRSEIEQLRDREEKLNKSIEAMKQRHEQDMSSIRRHAAAIQREKADQVKQIEALTSELAIAKAQSRIGKHVASESESNHHRVISNGDPSHSDQGHSTSAVKSDTTPSSSPPSSPRQVPARNQAMEVETLKTSLAHAHRMVSNLRSGLHKEKTEKFELKKLLAESQETIEHFQNDPRLWVDAGPTRSTSSSGPSSRNEDGSRRPVKTAIKRRGGKKGTFESSNKRKNKINKAMVVGDHEYSDLSDNEESEMDSYDESDVDATGLDPKMAGFTSLSSELSQSQKPVGVHAQVNTDPIESLTLESMPVSESAPRSLGDELSIAMSRSPSTEEQEEKKQGVEITTQTDTELTITSQDMSIQTDVSSKGVEISVQTEVTLTPSESSSTQTDARVSLEQKAVYTWVNEPTRVTLGNASQAGTDVAPEDPALAASALAAATAAAIAAARQASLEAAIDVSTQSESILTQDHETQSEPVPHLDQGTQSDLLESIDCGVQSEVAQHTDAFVQSEPFSSNTKDASVQHEQEETSVPVVLADLDAQEPVTIGTQSEQVQALDGSAQYEQELPAGIDHGTQSMVPQTADSSVQSDSQITVDANVQYEPILSTETGVQARFVVETKDAQVQYEAPEETMVGIVPVEEDQDEFFDATSKPSSRNTFNNAAMFDKPESAKQSNALKAVLAAPLLGPALLASKLMNNKKKDTQESQDSVLETDGELEENNAQETLKKDASRTNTLEAPKKDTDVSHINALEVPKKDTDISQSNTLEVPKKESPMSQELEDNASVETLKHETSPFQALQNSAPEVVKKNTPVANKHDNAVVAPQDEKLYSKSETDAMIASAVASALAAATAAAAAIEKKDDKSILNDIDSAVVSNSSNMDHEDAMVSEKALEKRPSTELVSTLNHDHADIPSIITPDKALPSRPSNPPSSDLLIRAGLSPSFTENSKAPSDMSRAEKHESISVSSMSTNNTNEQLQSIASSTYDPRIGTDASIIQLITQTMVGDWLYKYTRKVVGGGISEKKHQRYFWIHPYSRRLFWSPTAPITDGHEGKAKCAVIEDVTVVPEHNATGENTPHVSLLIQTSHRQIKLTAPNMTIHDRWFEAISYLLSRTSATGSGLTFLNNQASTTGNNGSLMKRASFRIQDAFQHQPSILTSVQSMTTASDDEDDGEDEALEDVRMCCNGKHHVSKLEKDRSHRHHYRKRKSKNSMNRQHHTIS